MPRSSRLSHAPRAAERRDEETNGTYPAVVGADWELLPAGLRLLHEGPLRRASGVFQVGRGRDLLGRCLGALLRLPPDGPAQADLVVEATAGSERWSRRIGGWRLVTVQRAAGPHLIERSGLLELRFRVTVEDGGLELRQAGVALCLGPVRIALPGRFAPRVEASIRPEASSRAAAHVRVRLEHRPGRLLVEYEGVVVAVGDGDREALQA